MQNTPKTEGPRNAKPMYPIASVDNALRLLLMFRDHDQQLVRVADASERLGVGRSTAHRLLATLQYRGFVAQDPETRAYRAGPSLAEIGRALDVEHGLREYMRPFMQRLRDEINETVQLVVLEGAQGRFIETVESNQPVRTASRVGVVVPAHCLSAGKALLAALPRERLRDLYPTSNLPTATPSSITTREALEAELELVRLQKYATNFGESETEIASIGVVVRDTNRQPRVGLSVSAPLSRLHESDLTRVKEIANAANNTADEACPGLI